MFADQSVPSFISHTRGTHLRVLWDSVRSAPVGASSSSRKRNLGSLHASRCARQLTTVPTGETVIRTRARRTGRRGGVRGGGWKGGKMWSKPFPPPFPAFSDENTWECRSITCQRWDSMKEPQNTCSNIVTQRAVQLPSNQIHALNKIGKKSQNDLDGLVSSKTSWLFGLVCDGQNYLKDEWENRFLQHSMNIWYKMCSWGLFS